MNVVALLLGILAINAVVWVALRGAMRRRLGALREALASELRRSGEAVPVPPRSALFNGSSGRFGSVRGNGLFCVTDRRLVFRKLVGRPLELPLADVASAEVTEGAYRGRTRWAPDARNLVVRFRGGGDAAFLVRDAERIRDELLAAARTLGVSAPPDAGDDGPSASTQAW